MRFPRQVGIGLVLLLALSACAQRVWVKPAPAVAGITRIAVLPLETDSFLSTVGSQLADEVVVDLLKNAPLVEVIERARVDAVVREQDLTRSRYISPDSAIALGKLLGVQALLAGSVSLSIGDIQPTPSNAQRVATGSATVRLIDTQTGKILWGDRFENQYSSFIGSGPDRGIGTVRTDQEMIQNVLRELAHAIGQTFYAHEEYRY